MEMLDAVTQNNLKTAFANEDIHHEGHVQQSALKSIFQNLGYVLTDVDQRKLMTQLGLEPDSTDPLELSVVAQLLILKLRGADISRDDEELREAFFILSQENGGRFVSARQLKRVMELIGENMNDDEIDDMLKEGDTDRDGNVGWEDFVKMMAFDEKSVDNQRLLTNLSLESSRSSVKHK